VVFFCAAILQLTTLVPLTHLFDFFLLFCNMNGAITQPYIGLLKSVKTMEKILVSACLMGEPVRYDGKSQLQENELFKQWLAQQRFVMVCPEVAGGLSTPRDPAEIIARGDSVEKMRVQTDSGEDVSQAFIAGAQLALKLCRQHNIKFALLSARSHSCGNEKIYDGQVHRQLIDGQGVTATLLTQHGIQVFNQFQLLELEAALSF
jgi:uncharacterized protein YbbK (DUF523 family)